MASQRPEGLTPKQQRFVDEYLIDLNATQAAIRAGYSERTAAEIGWENLSKPHVAHAIALAQAERATRTHIAQDDVIRGLLAETVVSGERGQAGARVRAWEILGKHLGLFPKDPVAQADVALPAYIVYMPGLPAPTMPAVPEATGPAGRASAERRRLVLRSEATLLRGGPQPRFEGATEPSQSSRRGRGASAEGKAKRTPVLD